MTMIPGNDASGFAGGFGGSPEMQPTAFGTPGGFDQGAALGAPQMQQQWGENDYMGTPSCLNFIVTYETMYL